MTHRIKSGWRKWRATTWILCDRGVPLKLYKQFYRMVIRRALLYQYGSKCWDSRKDHSKKVAMAEIQNALMDEWTYLEDRIQKEDIRKG